MVITSPAPVALFVYKRLLTTQQTIASLQQNELAQHTHLHIFSDAAADKTDVENVDAVREFIKSIKGFSTVSIYLSEKNKGLAKSIIEGVSQIINAEGKVIVLEDDLELSSNFLHFMNQGLIGYDQNTDIFSISGYSSPIKFHRERDVYFTTRASSWGWATWKDRWDKIDWNVSHFAQFKNDVHQQKEFNKMGSDLTHMLKKQMNGEINSWAIRWVFHQFKYKLLTAFPVVSKVRNNGFHTAATHTSKNNETRFSTFLDRSGKTAFDFAQQPSLEQDIIKQFVVPYTIKTRVLYKIKAILHL